jgi:hypothetical protein
VNGAALAGDSVSNEQSGRMGAQQVTAELPGAMGAEIKPLRA